MKAMGKCRNFSAWASTFVIGGFGYNLIEILWQGRSHWTMTLTGGVCLCILYGIRLAFPRGGILSRCALSACAITAVEFAVGCVVNLWLGMGVWSYSSLPFNLLGQICLTYSLLWFLISFPCDMLCGKMKKIFS